MNTAAWFWVFLAAGTYLVFGPVAAGYVCMAVAALVCLAGFLHILSEALK